MSWFLNVWDWYAGVWWQGWALVAGDQVAIMQPYTNAEYECVLLPPKFRALGRKQFLIVRFNPDPVSDCFREEDLPTLPGGVPGRTRYRPVTVQGKFFLRRIE